MKFPILAKATDSYRSLFPSGKRQEVLMSAEYRLDHKSYRVVGTVKKSLFGKIKDYNFLDFVVIDEKGTVIKDLILSKRIYSCFTTLSMMYTTEKHIQGSILEIPTYFLPIINKYDEIVQRATPVLRVFKKPKEYYEQRFDAFYKFLVASNQTNIDADKLARELDPVLEKAKKLEAMHVIEIETYNKTLDQFINITHERTLLVLLNKEVFVIIELILNNCRAEKDIQLDDFKQEIDLIRQIIRGVNIAHKNTVVNVQLEFKLKKEEEIISHYERLKQRDMLDDITEKQFLKQWLYRI
ncbi:hypothetical protein IM538_21280 [Cytobacillus suaedae]|nr:hypothetical protein IM538_21280 [Cytobacillus suaedae]